jgi:hypothetical protein
MSKKHITITKLQPLLCCGFPPLITSCVFFPSVREAEIHVTLPIVCFVKIKFT